MGAHFLVSYTVRVVILIVLGLMLVDLHQIKVELNITRNLSGAAAEIAEENQKLLIENRLKRTGY